MGTSARPPWALIGGIVLVGLCGVAGTIQQAEEKAARARRLEIADNVAEAKRNEAAVHERLERQREEAAEAKHEEERQKGQDAEIAGFRLLSPAERESKLRAHCSPTDGCLKARADVIVEAAATPAEGRKLAGLRDAALSAQARRAGVVPADAKPSDLRRAYAERFDQVLLQKHMNPDGVRASGPDATTLHIDGWFCTRQTVFDLANGEAGAEARAIGFRKIECASAAQSWNMDLLRGSQAHPAGLVAYPDPPDAGVPRRLRVRQIERNRPHERLAPHDRPGQAHQS